MKIRVKIFDDSVEIPSYISKGEWVDLRSRTSVVYEGPYANILKQKDNVKQRNLVFNAVKVPLNIAVELPKGYEAIIASRSSTFKNFGMVMSNSIGVVDYSYRGDNDEWKWFGIPFRGGVVNKGDAVCQFKIQLSQKATMWQKIKWLFSNKIEFEFVDKLNDNNRGGFGTTGKTGKE